MSWRREDFEAGLTSDPSFSKAPTVSFPPRVASIASGWSDPDAGRDLHSLKTNTLYNGEHQSRPSFRALGMTTSNNDLKTSINIDRVPVSVPSFRPL